ncbi:hypothetical protein EV363DRAFT_1359648 [Boletus edulis]|nr:hypothetical protein EV363DRAFT_1359648 [Boletus edulis]
MATLNVGLAGNGRSDVGLCDEDIERHALSLRGRTLTASLAIVAGTGFTLFGYASNRICPIPYA